MTARQLAAAFTADWLVRQVVSESTRGNYESFLRIHRVPRLGRKTVAGWPS